MTNIKLNTTYIPDATAISNYFFDNYMPQANGDFVKVYLYLLRCLTDPSKNVSVSFIADKLNITDNDVERALRYWASINLVEIEYRGKVLTGVTILPLTGETPQGGIVRIADSDDYSAMNSDNVSYNTSAMNSDRTSHNASVMDSNKASYAEDNEYSAVSSGSSNHISDTNTELKSEFNNDNTEVTDDVPKKKIYTKSELKPLLENDEVSELLFITEKYLGKTLNQTEASTILYFYDTLKFPAELIDYLVEYCVSKGTQSMRYIEKVALEWDKAGIRTVREAKEQTNTYSKNVFAVMKAFGLNGRGPGDSEKKYIDMWYNSYGFSLDIIIEACNRTIQTIHQPSFEYADSILKKWRKQEVKGLSDLKVLDEKHAKNKDAKAKENVTNNNSKTSANARQSGTSNKFNSFPQRSYDYAELEKQLLNK